MYAKQGEGLQPFQGATGPRGLRPASGEDVLAGLRGSLLPRAQWPPAPSAGGLCAGEPLTTLPTRLAGFMGSVGSLSEAWAGQVEVAFVLQWPPARRGGSHQPPLLFPSRVAGQLPVPVLLTSLASSSTNCSCPAVPHLHLHFAGLPILEMHCQGAPLQEALLLALNLQQGSVNAGRHQL